VPLAIIFGAGGVVAGTLLAYLLGAGWFTLRFRDHAPEIKDRSAGTLAKAALWGVLFALVGGAIAALAASAIPVGWALVVILVVTAGALAGFLACALSIRPTPAGVRSWRSDFADQFAARASSTTQSP
jgi:hypothetical protein